MRRARAVCRRTWEWSSPKWSLPNSKSSSTGQRRQAPRTRAISVTGCPGGT
uniref:hypothetical protein n=1 Tax=Kibdelosporangium aridum TaxID=2030 RepID=UPI00190E6E91|nr:hypothetical protein [Kibdelosporangium aridum]